MPYWNIRYFAVYKSGYAIAAAIIGIILVTSAFGKQTTAKYWPKVEPVSKDFHFLDGTTAKIHLILYGANKDPLYRLECHSRGYADPDFDYSGDFECRLTSLYSENTYSTLFTYDPHQSRDWESRARFFAVDVTGKCAHYPEFGLVRHFHLRGMKITLAMSDVQLRAPAESEREQAYIYSLFKSFRFHVGVRNDSTAISKIDVPVKENPQYGKCNENFVEIK